MGGTLHRGMRKPFGFWRTPEVLQVLADFAAGRMAREEAYRRLDITHYGEPKAAETLDWYVRKLRRSERHPHPGRGGYPGAGIDVAVERVTLGEGGRLVIPASFRQALSLREGEEVIVRLEDGALRILTPRHALTHAQRLVREHVPDRRSLAGELLAERRREASRE